MPKSEYKELQKIKVGHKRYIVLSTVAEGTRLSFDIREHIKASKYNGPTRKGFRVVSDKWEEFQAMINKFYV